MGDPKYWRGGGAGAVPMVGALREGKTKIGGEWYEMGQHGFAKEDGICTCQGRTSESVSLRLSPLILRQESNTPLNFLSQ